MFSKNPPAVNILSVLEQLLAIPHKANFWLKAEPEKDIGQRVHELFFRSISCAIDYFLLQLMLNW